MSKPKPLIYAELLSNIRQVSIIAALEAPSDSATKAELSANHQQILLHHAGDTTILNLPGQVAASAQLQQPGLGCKELSWRLPMSGQIPCSEMESTGSTQAPWSASTLEEGAEFACRECGQVIVRKGAVKTWKDLPSENWAEMMDFWHCHKPDAEPDGSSDHDGHFHAEHSVLSKGYGANTKFVAMSGLGFVDMTNILISASNCTTLDSTGYSATRGVTQMGNLTETEGLAIACPRCHHYLGIRDHQAEGLRLYKWRLSLTTPSRSCRISSITKLISAQLLSIQQAQLSSRFILHPFSPVATNLLLSTKSPGLPESSPPFSLPSSSYLSLWVFAWSLRFSATVSASILHPSTQQYHKTKTSHPSSSSSTTCLDSYSPLPPTSSSESPSKTATPGALALKVFWKVVDEQAATMLMDKQDVEDIALPTEAILELEQSLRNSSLVLPPSARKFQDWDVGLLERWEG